MGKRFQLMHVPLIFPALMVAGLLVAISRPTTSRAGQPMVLWALNDGGVHYTVTFDPVLQKVDAIRNYDYLSASGVREYIAFNRARAEEYGRRTSGQLRVNVVFSRPLAQAEFEAFVHNYGLRVHRYTMRAVESSGARVTISGAPDDASLVPAPSLALALNDLSARGAAELKGWIEAEVTTDPPHLREMQAERDVFITELGHSLIFEALAPSVLRKAGATDETIRKVQGDPDSDTVQISGPPLYWFLEEAGLVEMPAHSGN